MSNVKGMEEVKKALAEYAKQSPRALAAAVYQEGVRIIGQAVKQCPVDQSILIKSHYVTGPEDRAGKQVVELGFGTDYAVPVHEKTGVHHDVGKAKFLEDPMNEAMSGYHNRLVARTKANIESGTEWQAAPGVPQRPRVGSRNKRSKKGKK